MPEVFAGSNTVLMMNGRKHPLAGFLTLSLLENTFVRMQTGTVFQMKDKLIASIRDLFNNSRFTIHKIIPLLNKDKALTWHTVQSQMGTVLGFYLSPAEAAKEAKKPADKAPANSLALGAVQQKPAAQSPPHSDGGARMGVR